MKYDQMLTYTEVVRNQVELINRGSDGRYYVSYVTSPDIWHFAGPTFTHAMRHLNFTKEFWQEKIDMKDEPRVARVEGTHYMVGKEVDGDLLRFRGFGGSLFLIQFDDGRRAASTNLWCQGEIPVALRTQLPDNAKFISTEGFNKARIQRWLEHMEATHGTQAQ